jgi:serine/threonine-protein kinase
MPNEVTTQDMRQAFPDVDFHREIEEGNIKQVFEADYENKHVAFKVVTYDEGSRLEGYTQREIDIMQQIDSEVLVEFIDAFEQEITGSPAYVIIEEYIEGRSLKESIRKDNYGIELACEVSDAIFQVLTEFDDGNIVHRDIKPENIRINEEGEIRLLDVGVARMNERETLTPAAKLQGPGTPAYSAPEVLMNERYNQDVKTDLFSTGIVFFETITGEHPFAHDVGSCRDAILQDNRMDLSGYLENPQLEEYIDEFYKRLTENEPADRYRKPEHAKDDLDEIKGEWL